MNTKGQKDYEFNNNLLNTNVKEGKYKLKTEFT